MGLFGGTPESSSSSDFGSKLRWFILFSLHWPRGQSYIFVPPGPTAPGMKPWVAEVELTSTCLELAGEISRPSWRLLRRRQPWWPRCITWMKHVGTPVWRATPAVACPAENPTVSPTVWRDLWTQLFSSPTGQIQIVTKTRDCSDFNISFFFSRFAQLAQKMQWWNVVLQVENYYW